MREDGILPALMKPKNAVLLGTTGSIGVSTQKVAADLPGLTSRRADFILAT
jgi:hypothetical protein